MWRRFVLVGLFFEPLLSEGQLAVFCMPPCACDELHLIVAEPCGVPVLV